MTLSQWLATILASVALWTYNLEPEILPGGGREPVHFRARRFGSSMVSDARASLMESIAFQRTTDPPVTYVQTRRCLSEEVCDVSSATMFVRGNDVCEVASATF